MKGIPSMDLGLFVNGYEIEVSHDEATGMYRGVVRHPDGRPSRVTAGYDTTGEAAAAARREARKLEPARLSCAGCEG